MQNARLSHPFTIRFREYSRCNLRILGLLVLSTVSCVSSAWAVYPQSSVISSVVWDFDGRVKAGPGSDLWPVTWGKNGVTYVAWGDGGGPNGTNNMCRTNFGLAKLTGSPPNYGFTAIWGCKADGTGCTAGATHNAACDAPYGGVIATWGVPYGLTAVDNTLYALMYTDSTGNHLLSSANYGQSWSDAGSFDYNSNGTFIPTGFVKHGAGDAGGSGTYLYIIGYKIGSTFITLARAPKASVTNTATWEYFTGTSGSPSWGSVGSATQIFNHDVSGGSVAIQYFPVIGKYILTEQRNSVQQFGVYEAANPWGPWFTVYYNDTWGNYGTSVGEGTSIVGSSINGTDTEFYMTFSGDATPVDWDNYNLIKGTFVLQSTPTVKIPKPPASIDIH
jgi:hypothetical protein